MFITKKAAALALLAAVGLCAYQLPINPVNDPVYKNLDPTVKPGDDFFAYANGGWIKRNPIQQHTPVGALAT
jgi:putative endopeptidase